MHGAAHQRGDGGSVATEDGDQAAVANRELGTIVVDSKLPTIEKLAAAVECARAGGYTDKNTMAVPLDQLEELLVELRAAREELNAIGSGPVVEAQLLPISTAQLAAWRRDADEVLTGRGDAPKSYGERIRLLIAHVEANRILISNARAELKAVHAQADDLLACYARAMTARDAALKELASTQRLYDGARTVIQSQTRALETLRAQLDELIARGDSPSPNPEER